MASAVINREIVRDKLATLLSTALVGTGKPAQAVYNYQIGDFQGQSPVVVVTSHGSRRTRLANQTFTDTHFLLDVHVFVLYTDIETGGTWTEALSEDRLDLLEKSIADVIVDNSQIDNYWNWMTTSETSDVSGITVGGLEYRHEVITVDAQVLDQ